MKVRMLQDEVGLDVSSKDLLRQAWKHDASNLLRGWGERTRASSGGAAPWSAVHNHAPHLLCALSRLRAALRPPSFVPSPSLAKACKGGAVSVFLLL